MRSVDISSGRGSIPRARSRSEAPDLAAGRARQSSSASAASAPIVSIPPAAQPRLGARADSRQQADRERREERRLASGPHDRQPAGLAAVGGDLRDHLRAREAERAREPRARADHRLHGLGERAGVVEGRRDLAEVEVALVDPGLLDRRHDLADERPDLLRVLAVERTCAGGRTSRAGSAAAPRRTTSPRRCRSAAPRSSPSPRRRGRAGRRRRRAAARGARGSPAPPRRRRTRRGRGARRSRDEGIGVACGRVAYRSRAPERKGGSDGEADDDVAARVGQREARSASSRRAEITQTALQGALQAEGARRAAGERADGLDERVDGLEKRVARSRSRSGRRLSETAAEDDHDEVGAARPPRAPSTGDEVTAGRTTKSG